MATQAQSMTGTSTPLTEGVATPLDTEKGLSIDATKEEDASTKREITGWRWFLVCLGIYLTALLYGLDTTIAADVQAPILESLGHIELLAWIGIGFPMGSVAVILLVGALFGNFEFKYLYLGSLFLFEVGSALCGAAPSMNALIVGRVLAGMGGAGIYLGGLNYVAVFTTLQERGLYVAGIGLFWGLGCILGPLIGGAFADSAATWRWAFYINLVLAGVTAPIYLLMFPRFSFRRGESAWAKLKQIDWVGFLLNATVFCLFMVVLTFAGSQWRWGSPGTIVLFVLDALALAVFAMQQIFCVFTTTETRIFPVQLLKSRTMLLIFLATAISSTGLFYPVYYVPLFFQFTKGDTAIDAAVRLLPYICVLIFAMMVTGGFLPKIGTYAPLYLITGIFMVIGGALLYTVTPTTSTSAIYGYEVLIAIGVGIGAQIGYTIAASKVPPQHVSGAIGFINVGQLGSAAVSLAISGAIFQNIGVANLANALAEYDFPRSELQNALAGVQSTILSAKGADVRNLAIGAIVKTISSGYAFVFAAGAVLVLSSLAMKWERLQLTPTAG